MTPQSATRVGFVAGERDGPEARSDLRSLAAAMPPAWQPVWLAAAPGSGPRRLLAEARAVAHELRAAGVGLVHVDAADRALPYVMAARWLGAPCVVRSREARSGRGLLRLGLTLADAVVFDSLAARDAARWRTGFVVPRGVDPPGVALDAGAARRALGALPGQVVVAHVGPLAPLLGCDLALEAVAILRRRNLPLRLALIGDDRQWEGRYRSLLWSLADGLGVADAVTIQADPPAGDSLLRGVDVLVCAAREGADPRPLLAALAAGVPVVATRVGAVPEWVRDGHEGLLVAPEDLAGLVRALEQLVIDAPLRSVLGARGAQRARTEFSWERSARRMASLYDAVSAPYLRAVAGAAVAAQEPRPLRR